MDKLNVSNLQTPGQLRRYAEHHNMANVNLLEDFNIKYWGNSDPGEILRIIKRNLKKELENNDKIINLK